MRSLTPAEKWARYDAAVEMAWMLSLWWRDALSVGDTERAAACAIAVKPIVEVLTVLPTCPRPERPSQDDPKQP